MNKNDIVNKISQNHNMTKKSVNLVIDSFISLIEEALKNNEKVIISKFGSFEKSITKEFDIYSPYDGKLLKDVSQVRVRFKSSDHLKNYLNEE